MRKVFLLVLAYVMFIFPIADLSELAAREAVRCRGSLWNSFGEIVEDQTSEVVFRIFNKPDGGEVLWEEGHSVKIKRSECHFILGSEKTGTGAFDLNMFIENESWLEVSVDGDVLSPRQPVADFQTGYLIEGEKYSMSLKRDARFEEEETLAPMIIWENTTLHSTLDMGDNGIRLGGELRTTWPAGPADEFSQEEVDNLQGTQLADGTTPWTDASNLSTGVIENTLLDDDLQDLADGSLSSTRVEHGDLFIQTAGVKGQVWKSDGEGSGYWGVDNTENDGWVITGDHVYTSLSGNVGVGITDPEEKLHVDGNILVSAGHIIKSDAGLTITIDSDGDSTSDFFSISHDAGGAELLRIDQSGNMGVGTTNMSEKLDVNGGIKIGSASGVSEGVISYDSVNKLMKYSDGQSWVAMKNPVVTVGLSRSGADFECDGVDDQVQIQAALDSLGGGGGGSVKLLGGVYNNSASINWDKSNVKLQGEGWDGSVINCDACNAIESDTNGARIVIEDVTIQTSTNTPQQGIGIYIKENGQGQDVTVDLYLSKVKFITTLNAIHYSNDHIYEHSEPIGNLIQLGVSLGNIEIVRCSFPSSCTNTTDAHYIHGRHISGFHKVLINGNKPYDKRLNISFNEFRCARDGSGNLIQNNNVVELNCSGETDNDPLLDPIENQPFIWGGQIAFNKFDGATRECMLIRSHRNLNIIGNKMKGSGRIGFYFNGAYESNMIGNICEGSLYRGHRIDGYYRSVYSNNIAVETGLGGVFKTDPIDEGCVDTEGNPRECVPCDGRRVYVGGMTINSSRDNIIIGNTIMALMNSAILIVGNKIGWSTGNYIAFNKVLGEYTDVTLCEKDKNTGNTIIQPENYGVEYPEGTVLKGLKIEKSFDRGVSSKNLELYFPFFEDSGSYIQDYSKNGVIAEVEGVLNRIKGIFGNAVQFDGSASNYIRMSHTMGSYDATYYLVFRPNNFDAIQWLIDSDYNDDPFDPGRYYILNLTSEEGGYGNVQVRYHTGTVWSTEEFNAPILSTSEIVRLMVTFEENDPNINVKVYMNGKLSDSETMTGKPSLGSSVLGMGGSPGNPFNGDLHLFKAWSRLLTEEEIWEETFNPVETAALEAYKLKGQTETVTGPGALNPVMESTLLITTGADAFTLDDGVENAEKFIMLKTDGGDGALTPTNFINGTSIVFDDVGDSAHLKFFDGGWVWFGGTATLN